MDWPQPSGRYALDRMLPSGHTPLPSEAATTSVIQRTCPSLLPDREVLQSFKVSACSYLTHRSFVDTGPE